MICRALALAALTGLLTGCSSSNPNSVAVASWSGAFVCGASDVLFHALIPETRFTVGPTGAVLGLPLLADGSPEARAFSDAC